MHPSGSGRDGSGGGHSDSGSKAGVGDDKGGAATSDGCVDDAAVRWIACIHDWTGNVVVYPEDAVDRENAVKV